MVQKEDTKIRLSASDMYRWASDKEMVMGCEASGRNNANYFISYGTGRNLSYLETEHCIAHPIELLLTDNALCALK